MYSRKGDHITEIFDQVRARMTGSGADGGQAVQYDVCSLFFGHFFKGLFAVLGYHGDYICFGAESGAAGSKGVGTDHITVLGSKFFPGIFQQVFGFHGKAAEKLADSIGDKTAGNRKSGQAFADIQGTLDLSKAGSIIQTGEVADKINQAAEKA